jgi:hypothetical protein
MFAQLGNISHHFEHSTLSSKNLAMVAQTGLLAGVSERAACLSVSVP